LTSLATGTLTSRGVGNWYLSFSLWLCCALVSTERLSSKTATALSIRAAFLRNLGFMVNVLSPVKHRNETVSTIPRQERIETIELAV
jgi:hypothetical protein